MYTWNLQYFSKNKLSEAFSHMMLDSRKGDILIRIHTATHTPDEAVELAAFIHRQVPGAHIVGTSTSAVIYRGKLIQNQCVVSVTQMEPSSRIMSAMIPAFQDRVPVSPDRLCETVRDTLTAEDTRLMLVFLTNRYRDVHRFVERSNAYMPGVDMIGGLANAPADSLAKFNDLGFVFNESGWSRDCLLAASISGRAVACVTSYATGAEAVGGEIRVSDTFGSSILTFNDDEDAAAAFAESIGIQKEKAEEMTSLFPYVYSDAAEIPIIVRYDSNVSLQELFPDTDPANARFYAGHPEIDTSKKRELISANHNVMMGKKFRRAFFYDRKIVNDNRDLFRKIESFEKQETIFGYTCSERSVAYRNCVKWELSIYEDTNMCGCITEGEIAHLDGRNAFANCSFVVSVIGEAPFQQRFNTYAFASTDNLSEDNRNLLQYLTRIEEIFSRNGEENTAQSLRYFALNCERKLMHSADGAIPNGSALRMDMMNRGYDRVCMVHIPDTGMMETVFGKNRMLLTHQQFRNKCEGICSENGYRIYEIEKWLLAIAVPSYVSTLGEFCDNMKRLQTQLLETPEGCIQVMPNVCVLDDCNAEELTHMYRTAQREMNRTNLQYFVHRPLLGKTEIEKFQDKYRIINLLHYALANDKVIPYYMGIRNNHEDRVTAYEALMRIEDEKGGIHYPGEFLGVARKFGSLYDGISEMMIRKVFARFDNVPGVKVSMNLGIRDIENEELMRYVYGFLSTTAYPGNFVLEILESEDIDDYDVIREFVSRVHLLGAKVALDDFGSGFSNLQHVVNLDFDFLKIDGSIVRKCAEDETCRALLGMICSWKGLFGRDINIVAEFVENEAIQNILMQFEVDYSQGFLFAFPEKTIDLAAGEVR